jgi:hypothetical protein
MNERLWGILTDSFPKLLKAGIEITIPLTVISFALALIIAVAVVAPAQQIALLKYNGGGDWYANPTSLPNLIKFCNQNLGMSLEAKPATVEVGSADLYRYPFVHMTGHGNVAFTDAEAENLRNYLIAGGFLHADDNYGM